MIKKLFPIAVAILASATLYLITPNTTVQVEPTPTPTPAIVCPDDICQYAFDYAISEIQYRNTIKCESGFKHEGLFGDNGNAYGIAQFHFWTFYQFRKTAIAQGYPFENFQYEDREDQLELMAWAFLNNLQSHWTCFTKQFRR